MVNDFALHQVRWSIHIVADYKPHRNRALLLKHSLCLSWVFVAHFDTLCQLNILQERVNPTTGKWGVEYVPWLMTSPFG